MVASELETLQEENKRLREIAENALNEKAQLRSDTAKVIFKGLGLKESSAELFIKTTEGYVTPEAVRGWATAYGLLEEPQEEENTGGFEPGKGGG